MFKLFLTFLTLCISTCAYSFDCADWYLKGLAGYNHVSTPTTPSAHIETNAGYVVGGAIGYRLTKIFRIEGELSYRHNSLDQLIIHGETANIQVALEGSISSFVYMGNILFNLPCDWILVPYFGIGAGGYHEWGNESIPLLEGTPDEVRIRVKQWSMAYQPIAGLTLVHTCKMNFALEYHFLDSFNKRFSNQNHSLALVLSAFF